MADDLNSKPGRTAGSKNSEKLIKGVAKTIAALTQKNDKGKGGKK